MLEQNLGWWKGQLVTLQNAKVVNSTTKRLLAHARSRVEQIERQVLVKVACCLLVLPLVGCSKQTNQAIGDLIGGAGKVVSGVAQDVGEGISQIGNERGN